MGTCPYRVTFSLDLIESLTFISNVRENTMRVTRLLMLGLLLLPLLAACDSGGPPPTPSPAGTSTPDLYAQYNVPATITALVTAGAQATLTFPDLPQPKGIDACDYLTPEDVEAVMGFKVTETPRGVNDSTASCTLSGDAEYISLSIYEFESESEPAALVRPPGTPPPGYESFRREFVPGVADGAVLSHITSLRSQAQNPGPPSGWQMQFKEGTRYYALRWITKNIDDGDDLIELTNKILGRL